MPFSAYLEAGLFVVAAAAALFLAAGTITIPAFWVYLTIFAIVNGIAAWFSRCLMEPKQQRRPERQPA